MHLLLSERPEGYVKLNTWIRNEGNYEMCADAMWIADDHHTDLAWGQQTPTASGRMKRRDTGSKSARRPSSVSWKYRDCPLI
jgi:hypothetical protein